MSTTNLGIVMLAPGQEDQDVTINTGLQTVDNVLSETLVIDMADEDLNLTLLQARASGKIEFTGTLTANRAVVFPDNPDSGSPTVGIKRVGLVVSNKTVGGFDLTIGYSSGDTVTLGAAQTKSVSGDGVDFEVEVQSDGANFDVLDDSGSVVISQPGELQVIGATVEDAGSGRARITIPSFSFIPEGSPAASPGVSPGGGSPVTPIGGNIVFRFNLQTTTEGDTTYVDAVVTGFSSREVLSSANTAYSCTRFNVDRTTMFTSSDPVTITIEPVATRAWVIGDTMNFLQKGAGQLEVVGGSGVTIIPPFDCLAKSEGQGSMIGLVYLGSNEWSLQGAVERDLGGSP